MRNLHNFHTFCVVKHKAGYPLNYNNKIVAISSKKKLLVTKEYLYESYFKDNYKTKNNINNIKSKQ